MIINDVLGRKAFPECTNMSMTPTRLYGGVLK